MAALDFWYSIGSTYSYLTVMRIRDAAARAAVEVRWRPFNVREIMIRQNNIPFKDKPVKTAYMWRDIERRAAGYGMPVAVPAPYPLAELALANRVAVLGMQGRWGVEYTIEAYRLWFQEGVEPGGAESLSRSLAAAGQGAEAVLDVARSDVIGARLAAETEECEALGVFGSPSFVVAGEVFWGDDRLEDALAWAVRV